MIDKIHSSITDVHIYTYKSVCVCVVPIREEFSCRSAGTETGDDRIPASLAGNCSFIIILLAGDINSEGLGFISY